MVPKHLTYKEMTNYGCFYTPKKFVDKMIDLIKRNIKNHKDFVYIDTSCGYGSFFASLSGYKTIGCDIDPHAIEVAKEKNKETKFYLANTIYNFSRFSINLKEEDKIILIGNPPYNDTTSKVKQGIKNSDPCEIDDDLKTRDLGISFMLSYNKLKADYVAILHPLSYMIKKSNFELLKDFYKNYSLVDHCIINSQEFSMTSKTKGFPIIIALYKRDYVGLSFEEVQTMNFKTIDNRTFNLQLDFIKNYISKYPLKNAKKKEDDILFWTMRDINALNRNRTFIQNYTYNTIIIDKKKFEYYCYVDVFKQYIKNLPYYYGNCDVFIDNKLFKPIKDVFITNCVERYPWLKEKNVKFTYNNDYSLIDKYFKKLFGG